MDWTECAEKLPDKPGTYMVVVSGYHGYRCRKIVSFFITSLYTGKNGPGWCELGEDGYSEVKGVTHWMELPELPEE